MAHLKPITTRDEAWARKLIAHGVAASTVTEVLAELVEEDVKVLQELVEQLRRELNP
jgi:hypothetical protein